eukprot:gb/GEZN01007690.1/.p1 GENE.gb/GEZN01007690.1/~~gb/GEZN01007690.1/.p1  ORF type:complete len:474 (-),score=75.46 gb/GEZN01007690.1/:64-1485(-)
MPWWPILLLLLLVAFLGFLLVWKRFFSGLPLGGFSAKSNQSTQSQKLDSQDALWLLTDGVANPMVVCSLTVCDKIALEEFQKRVMERGVDMHPRLKQRIVTDQGGLIWELDPAFALDRHVSALHSTKQRPWSLQQVQNYIATTWYDPLPKDRPLWQWLLVEHFQSAGEQKAKSAIIWKSHHALGDGLSLMEFFYSCMDTMPQESRQAVGLRVKDSAVRIAVKMLYNYPSFAKKLVCFRLGTRCRALSGKRVVFNAVCSTTVQNVKSIKDKLNIKFNDVLMCALAIGLCTSGVHSKAHPEHTSISLLMPFSFRSKSAIGELNNRFSMVMLQLPKPPLEPSPSQALSFLRDTARRMDALKQGGDPLLSTLHARLLKYLPDLLQQFLLGLLDGADAIVSNVPGLSEPFQLLGGKVYALTAFPPTFRHVGLGLGFHTYQGQLSLGLSADESACPEPEHLFMHFDKALSTLLTAVKQC